MGAFARLRNMFARDGAAPGPRPPIAPGVHTVQGGPAAGLQLLVNDRAPAFREMIAGTYDAFLWRAIDGLGLQPGMVLDVGAHIGYHSLAFANHFPAAYVVAFEPNPVNVARIHEQLALNPAMAARMAVRASALAETTGTMDMQASTNIEDQTSSGGHLATVRPVLEAADYARAGFTSMAVAVERLDDVVFGQAWAGIGLVKIDVEGAEQLVLQGAMETLRRDRPVLLVEVHSVACMHHVSEILHILGYHIVLIHEDNARRAFIMARPLMAGAWH